MAFPELTAFKRHFESTAPDDRGAHSLNIGRLKELADYLASKKFGDLAACLHGARGPLHVLTLKDTNVGREAAHDLVLNMLGFVEQALEDLFPRLEEVEKGEEEPGLEKVHDMVFGEMLVQLGHATREQVEAGLERHRQMGIPIGECMLLMGIVTPDVVLETLALQEKLRSGVDHEARKRRAEVARRVREKQQALAKELVGEDVPEEADRKTRLTVVNNHHFLGEVLLGAGMISMPELEKAMFLHHHEKIRIGEALIRIGALTEEQLQEGLELHERLRHTAGMNVSF